MRARASLPRLSLSCSVGALVALGRGGPRTRSAATLLFLLCLILPLRSDPRRLLGVVTAFTFGHSATLIPAALGMAPDAAWFLPLVETLIAGVPIAIIWVVVYTTSPPLVFTMLGTAVAAGLTVFAPTLADRVRG